MNRYSKGEFVKIILLDGTEQEYVQTKQIIKYLNILAKNNNTTLETIQLREKRISHCTKCLICTNKQGVDPVKCFLEDGMDEVIDHIEKANTYIIITDRTSIFKKNKLFRKFAARLVGYYYRATIKDIPRRRRPSQTKKAIVINYNLSNFFTNASYEIAKYHIRKSTKDIGAKVLDSLLLTPANTDSNKWEDYEVKIAKLFCKLL